MQLLLTMFKKNTFEILFKITDFMIFINLKDLTNYFKTFLPAQVNQTPQLFK
jgi:hypothetical protein